MELTSDGTMDVLDIKQFPSEITGYTLSLGRYEISDINKMLEYFLPEIVKVNITIDDIRLQSNLKTIQTLIFTKKSSFDRILGFTQSHSGVLGVIEGLIQLIPVTFKSDKAINITDIDKVPLKCDCIKGSIVNGVRESVIFSFTIDQPPAPNLYKKPRMKLF